jgi:mRNA-degrading endonuclease RelE of RelBE toxin-antitoxin system
MIGRKIQEILVNPHTFKPMRFPLAGKRSVHFGSFVLLFSVDEQRKTVSLEDYDHHDRIYRTK